MVACADAIDDEAAIAPTLASATTTADNFLLSSIILPNVDRLDRTELLDH